MPWGWSQPVYYEYGPDEYIDYRDDGVYVDGKQYASGEEYYEQAATLAVASSQVSEEVEWLPLGVFACMQKGVSQTHRYMQLAVTREGIIGGTYFNETTKSSRPLHGTVDKETQRAAWTFADGKNTDTVAETSIHNFTKDKTPVLIHYGASKTEEIELIRVKAPKKDAKFPAKAAPDAEAAAWYGLAASYRASGHEDRVAEYVNKILKKYPKSEWADKAKALMGAKPK
jgi:tetratricopeptide (TPR) repeat protein